MRIEKFESMTEGKYKELNKTEKFLLKNYKESLDCNYPELAIELYPLEKESLIKDIIDLLKNFNIEKFLLNDNSSMLMEYLYMLKNMGCRLGEIVPLHTGDESSQFNKPVFEIHLS